MPTISAVISTYNRCAELAVSLPKLLAQTRPPDEIVIVDDGSTDGTRDLIAGRFPVNYVRLPENRGLIAARNVGMQRATGDYILSLDDDCWFLSEKGLAIAFNHAGQCPEAGVFSFNVVVPNGRPSLDVDRQPFPSGTFFGGASLLRRNAVISAGLYTEQFRYMGEESDLSMRLYELGFRVISVPDVLVYHAESGTGRDPSRIRYYSHRNAVVRELLRCPASLLPFALLRTWAANTRYNLAHGYWGVDASLALHLPFLVNAAMRLRRPVRRDTYRNWRRLP